MATVLFAWELGAGLGHVAQLLPLVKGLASSGHRVVLAIRELSKAALFEESGARVLQSPYRARSRSTVEPQRTFAHVLWNAGLGDPEELKYFLEAWRNLYDFVAPDLLVCEHSPVALLAARGRSFKRALLGNGFFCPPDVHPLPDLRPWMAPCADELRQHEQFVLDCVNGLLSKLGTQSLDYLAQLFREVDEVLLTTFPEFDHYQDRTNATYRGPWLLRGGALPTWPAGSGPRVYAYLSPSPALPRLLCILRESSYSTLISSGGLDSRLVKQFAAANMSFEPRPLNLAETAAQCNVAVLNGNHGTTIAMLLAGRPVLQVPIFLEQGLNAVATVRLEAGLSTFPTGLDSMAAQLQDLLHLPKYTRAAQRIANKYANFSQDEETCRAVKRLEELLARK